MEEHKYFRTYTIFIILLVRAQCHMVCTQTITPMCLDFINPIELGQESETAAACMRAAPYREQGCCGA